MEKPILCDDMLRQISRWFRRATTLTRKYSEANRVSTLIQDCTRMHTPNFTFHVFPTENHFMSKFVGKTFASISLTADRKKDLDEWVKTQKVTGLTAIESLLSDGYKVSLTWVDDQNSFCFSVIGTDNSRVNRDAIMTSWSDDLNEAAMIAAFKHYVMCDGGDWPLVDNTQRWG